MKPVPVREQSMTLRRRIVEELSRNPMTARDLSRAVHIPEKEVRSHLEHVEKSLRPARRIVIDPPVCHQCDYSFKSRRRYSCPGRCPRCRHEGISPPIFRIESS